METYIENNPRWDHAFRQVQNAIPSGGDGESAMSRLRYGDDHPDPTSQAQMQDAWTTAREDGLHESQGDGHCHRGTCHTYDEAWGTHACALGAPAESNGDSWLREGGPPFSSGVTPHGTTWHHRVHTTRINTPTVRFHSRTHDTARGQTYPLRHHVVHAGIRLQIFVHEVMMMGGYTRPL